MPRKTLTDTGRNELVVDARKFTTREINSSIKSALKNGVTRVSVLHPDARHNLAVGVTTSCEITFEGSVGYYCLSYCDGINAAIVGNAGWALGDNLMSGTIRVAKDAGASVAASMRGGSVIIGGDVGARAGISMKGGTLIVAGNSGFLTGFMMQKGRIIVLGDVGDAAGDSMYEGVLYFGGNVGSLGADAILKEVDSGEETEELQTVIARAGLQLGKSRFRKVVSGKRLYHYDSLEPLEKERFVI